MYDCRGFITEESMKKFDKSKIGKKLKKIISSKRPDLDKVAKIATKIGKDELKKSLGRKILIPDKKRSGELVEYERDVSSVAFVVARRGAVPDQIHEGEFVYVPTFEIAAGPSMRFNKIKSKTGHYAIYTMLKQSVSAIRKEEDTNVISAISCAADHRGDQVIECMGSLSTSSMIDAYRKIAQHGIPVESIIIHPSLYLYARMFFGKDFGFGQDVSVKEALKTGYGGTFYGSDIWVTCRANEKDVLFLSSPGIVGTLPFRFYPKVIHNPEPQKLRSGFTIWEEVGIFIASDWAVSKVKLVEIPELKREDRKDPEPKEELVKNDKLRDAFSEMLGIEKEKMTVKTPRKKKAAPKKKRVTKKQPTRKKRVTKKKP